MQLAVPSTRVVSLKRGLLASLDFKHLAVPSTRVVSLKQSLWSIQLAKRALQYPQLGSYL